MFSLIIADDHKIVRDGIRAAVQARGDIDIVAETGNGLETISSAKQFQPDLMLLDISMPYVTALEACVEIKRWSPNTRILVFTGVNTGSTLQELIDEGVKAIVLKSEDIQELTNAFGAVITGDSYLSPKVRELLESAHTFKQLTSREKQILKLVVAGNSTAEIAAMLSVSAKTIDNHRTNLMRKLNLHSVSELMAFAYREKIVVQPNDSQ